MSTIKFNKEHGTAISKNSFNVDIKLQEVNTRILGGGASQNFAALKLLEYYIAYEKPEYVVEIGSQKGGLSVYLGTIACATEQFIFHTFEIDKNKDWYNRENEGVGHWFEKMETISPFCKSIEGNIFSEEIFNFIKSYVDKYKTIIICDGGNKPREISLYTEVLKTGDIIMAHDYNIEINDSHIDFGQLEEHQPFCKRFVEAKTLFKTFVKK